MNSYSFCLLQQTMSFVFSFMENTFYCLRTLMAHHHVWFVYASSHSSCPDSKPRNEPLRPSVFNGSVPSVLAVGGGGTAVGGCPPGAVFGVAGSSPGGCGGSLDGREKTEAWVDEGEGTDFETGMLH